MSFENFMHFTRLSLMHHSRKILLRYGNYRHCPVQCYRNLKKLTQQGTIKKRQGSGRPRALNQNDEKSVCQKALRNQVCKQPETFKHQEALMCPNLRCIGYRENGTNNHISAYEIADGFDTWTIPALHRCMWGNY